MILLTSDSVWVPDYSLCIRIQGINARTTLTMVSSYYLTWGATELCPTGFAFWARIRLDLRDCPCVGEFLPDAGDMDIVIRVKR